MDHDSPRVSIILPVYNGQAFLADALQSVQSQDYPAIELVAVDDGSQDGSLEMLRAFAARFSRPVRILQHPAGAHRGIAATYRLALDACRGDLLAFLDQDDSWSDDKISAQVDAMESNQGVGLVFSDVYSVDEQGATSAEPIRGFLNRPPRDRAFAGLSRLLWGNYVLTFSGILLKRDVVTAADFVREPEGYQDWVLLQLVARRCSFFHCTRGRTYWRLHGDSFHGRNRRQAGRLSVAPGPRREVMCAVRRALEQERKGGSHDVTWSTALKRHYWTGVERILHGAYVLVDALRSIARRGARPTASTTDTAE